MSPASIDVSVLLTLCVSQIKSVATHTYDKADDATHLKFKKGEAIEIFKKDNTGWWVGRNAAGVVGTFPANHVQDGVRDFLILVIFPNR